MKNASISKINIERAAKKLRLSIYSSRPGIIIGKKGENIKKISILARKDLEKTFNKKFHLFLYLKSLKNKSKMQNKGKK